MPESPPLFARSQLLTWPQKLRVLGEYFVPARRDDADESLRDFGNRRLGKGFTSVFLDAMAAGIYGSTPDRISVRAAFPLIAALEREYGGLFRGMLAKRRQGAGPGGVLTSTVRGIGSMTGHLRDVIAAQWHLGEPVTSVVRHGARFSVESAVGSADFDQVVVAAPSYVAAGLLRELDPVLARMLGAIDYSPIAVVGFGYRTLQHPLDGFGLLTTTAARAPVLGVLWDSSIFPDRAPAGCKSLRSMIGGQRSPELVDQDDAGLIRTALQGLDQTMGVRDAPDVTFVKRWERCYPQLRAGSQRTSRRDLRQACGASRPALELQCVPGNRHERLRAQWARTGPAHRPLTDRFTTRYRNPRRDCSSRPRTCRARDRSGSR